MQLTSQSFLNNSELEKKYGCNGQGVVPQLSWHNFSQETRSFALIVEDPDAPSGMFVHWLIINIPVNITAIVEGQKIIAGSLAIINDGGQTNYVTPCPPQGKHRYFFKVFALNAPSIDNVNKDNFYQKIKPYILDQTEIMATYQK